MDGRRGRGSRVPTRNRASERQWANRMQKSETRAANAVLRACALFKAWPMAVNIVKPSWASRPMLQLPARSPL